MHKHKYNLADEKSLLDIKLNLYDHLFFELMQSQFDLHPELKDIQLEFSVPPKNIVSYLDAIQIKIYKKENEEEFTLEHAQTIIDRLFFYDNKIPLMNKAELVYITLESGTRNKDKKSYWSVTFIWQNKINNSLCTKQKCYQIGSASLALTIFMSSGFIWGYLFCSYYS